MQSKKNKKVVGMIAEVNENVRGTELAILEGKKLTVKRIGKRVTVCDFFGHNISIKNSMLNVL